MTHYAHFLNIKAFKDTQYTNVLLYHHFKISAAYFWLND